MVSSTPVLPVPVLLLAMPPHQEALVQHRDDPPVALPRILGASGAPRVDRVVYGYYPYWVDVFDRLRWDLLTHIAYFSVGISPQGELTEMHGWPSTNFVDTAHDFGLKADVCFTLFSGAGITTLTCSDANTANAVTHMIDAMESAGADGVNIDFEGLQSGTRDCFTRFIHTLREALIARGHPGAGIAIAAPAVDWTDSFDLAALAPDTDVFFIMGYGYHWGGSGEAGPVGQFRITHDWRSHISISMQRTVASYTAQIPAEARSVIVWGAPYYGNDWSTTSDQIHATTTGDSRSVTYAAARDALAQGRLRRWDPESQNPWYAYQAGGGFRQCWYEDEESLAAKYQLALEQGLGGVGMWALGYDGDHSELWDTLDAYFTAEPDPLEGGRAAPIPIDAFPFSDTRDTRLAPSNWFNWYGCAPALPEYGREWVYRIDLCRAGTLEASVTDGPGVDIDLHLLAGDTEADCLARDDATLSRELEPGSYLLVADSYVSDLIPQEGEYSLTVDFAPRDPSDLCGPVLETRPIELAALGSQPPLSKLADPAPVKPDPMGPPPEETTPALEDVGCACTEAGGRPSSGLASFIAGAAGWMWRRRRRRPPPAG